MNPRPARLSGAIILLLFILALISCGGSSSSSGSTPVTLAKITISPTTSSVEVGQELPYFAAPVDANNNAVGAALTWTSSAPAVATVDVNGKAVGVAPGTTQITASSNGITSNTATLNVTSSVKSVTISPMSTSVAVKGTRQFTATALDSSGNPVTGVTISWFCSFSGVATIDTNGLATGVSPGTVTIVASVGNVSSQPATMTVTP